jgi:hypothetical protein
MHRLSQVVGPWLLWGTMDYGRFWPKADGRDSRCSLRLRHGAILEMPPRDDLVPHTWGLATCGACVAATRSRHL